MYIYTLRSFHKMLIQLRGNKSHGISNNILETSSLSHSPDTTFLMFTEERMITSQCLTIFITLTDGTTNPTLFFMINNALVDSGRSHQCQRTIFTWNTFGYLLYYPPRNIFNNALNKGSKANIYRTISMIT